LLKEGLKLNDSSELRKSLSTFYAGLARSRLSESVLNRENAKQLFVQALQLDPEDKTLLRQALTWAGGTAFPEQALLPSIQLLREEASFESHDRLLLAEALASSGRQLEAIQIVTPLAEENHQLRPVLVRLLSAAGKDSEAKVLTQTILDQQQTTASEQSGPNLSTTVDRAEMLNLAGRFSDSVTLLESNPIPSDTEATDSEYAVFVRKWNQIYGTACLATFDSKLAAEAFESEEEAMSLLEKVFATNSQPVAVLERLVRLSCIQHDYAEAADQRLTQILAAGVANPVIYNLVGTQALQLNQPAKARQYLERAYSLGRDNPMVLNNLAIALVRDSSADPDRAMLIANAALKILPDHPDVLSTRAEIYVALERWEDARRDLEVSLPKRPQSRNSRKLIAVVYDQLGQPELAAEHRRILEKNE
jgi:tetratricopeptide (TPR) repeat protein